jgi:protein abrB
MQWVALLLFSVAVGGALVWLGVPAAFFLGSVLCGMSFRLLGARLKLPHPCFIYAQALVGCAAAKSMTPSVLGALTENWQVLGAMVLSSVIAGGLGCFARWGECDDCAGRSLWVGCAHGGDGGKPNFVSLRPVVRLSLF